MIASKEKKKLCFEVAPVWSIFLVYLVIGVIFLALAIGGLLGPEPIETIGAKDEVDFTKNPEGFLKILSGEEITGIFDDLSVYNDEILFTVTFYPNPNISSTMGFVDEIQMRINLKGANKVDFSDAVELSGSANQIHTRQLRCDQGSKTCQPLTLFHLPYVAYKYYSASMMIVNQEKQAKMDLFQPKLVFKYSSMNDNFVKFEIVFRYIFLFFNILVLGFFLLYTRLRQPFSLWHSEQKWIAFILAFLVLYNNPFYLAQYLTETWLFNLINIFFKVSFVAIILFSLLVFTHSIYTKEENRGVFSFYFPKGLLIITLWIVTVVAFILVSVTKKYDATFDFEELPYHSYISYTILALSLTYVLLLTYYVVRGVGLMRDLPTKYSSKFKLVYGVTLFVLIAAIFASIISYSLGKLSSFIFLASHALLNLWPFALAIFFLPSNEKHMGEDRDEIRILQGETDEDLIEEDEDEELQVVQEE